MTPSPLATPALRRLVQERLPAKNLGAEIASVEYAVNHYGLVVRVAGLEEPLLVGMDDLRAAENSARGRA
jgi:hypothetical protein